MAEGLKRMPYAASSRQAVISRLQNIIDQGTSRPLHMPRSGPWRHRMPNQRKMLPVYRGRTDHADVWQLPDPDAPRRCMMDVESWEDWHGRRASTEIRCLSSGHEWQVPTTVTTGHNYLSQMPDARSSRPTSNYGRSHLNSHINSSFQSYAGGGSQKAAFVPQRHPH
mmetsp:Transcript_7846/g.15429  ORF Transcript_7846/g.15429 Transcript_7846/m.15429 type:complete len:167 (-) Transcript_7846:141-641(-)